MDFFTSVPLSLTAPSLFFLLVAAISVGYSIRAMQRNKRKKQLLKLEDEMLRNHAKILSLEKIISDLKRENNQLKNIYARRSKESQLH
jgi:formate-dependent nitrite reductase membrane component NrfD